MSFLGVYGHVNLDTIILLDQLPERNTTVPAIGEIDRLGGTGGNIARAAATLGVPTGIASFVGSDFPREYQQILDDLAIDTTDLKRLDGRTPHVWLLSVPGGDSSCVIDQGVQQEGTQMPELVFTMLNSEYVHFTTGDPTMHLRMATQAAAARKHVAFDPGQELRYRYDSRTFERFLDTSEVLFVNRTELEEALKLLSYGDPVQLLDHVASVIATDGDKGMDWWMQGDHGHVDACPVRGEAPRDATGAGDVFRGGYYAAKQQEQPVPSAIKWGAAAASLFLEAEGAQYPTRQELAARVDEWTHGS